MAVSGEEVISQIHAQPLVTETVLCPYCGKGVLGFHDCPSCGGKVGFRYLQSGEKRSQFWWLLGRFLFWGLFVGGGYCGLGIWLIFWFERDGLGAIIFGVLCAGIGLVVLISGVMRTWKELQDVRIGLVAILEGPISRHWAPIYGISGSLINYHNIEVLGQMHRIEEELWIPLMEGDTVRIEQLPKSRQSLHIEAIARASKTEEKPPLTYPES